MATTSLISGTYQTASTMTLTGSSYGNTNDVLCIKHSVAIAGLNKFETKSMNPEIEKLANAFHTMLDLNQWGIVGLDFTSPLLQYQDLQYACFKIFISSLELSHSYHSVCWSLHFGQELVFHFSSHCSPFMSKLFFSSRKMSMRRSHDPNGRE